MHTRGPEGESVTRDERGNVVKSQHTVEFRGYRAYVRELLAEAGVIDPEVEAIVDAQRDLDRKMERLAKRFGTLVT